MGKRTRSTFIKVPFIAILVESPSERSRMILINRKFQGLLQAHHTLSRYFLVIDIRKNQSSSLKSMK